MQTRGLKFFGAAIVLLGAGFLFGWSVQAPTSSMTAPVSTGQGIVHLILDDDTGQLRTFAGEELFAGQTVFDILKSVTTRASMPFVYDPPGSYGVFIRQIAAKNNGFEKKYWQYWVNGQFAMVAADRYTLNSGDTILWKFASEQK